MNQAVHKILGPINALLACIAIFTVVLTVYSCTKFYTYLPTSDIWIYTDFLVHAAQGQLDVGDLFIKHNNAHLVALPKLIYFFDMWLANGTGAIVMLMSLSAMLATAGLFVQVISKISTINKSEKIFTGLLCIIFLSSACQAESLMNPANLQWSLLNFAATLTAWFWYRYSLQKSVMNLGGILSGMLLTTLTSASSLLIIIPLLLVLSAYRWGKKIVLQRGAVIFAALFLLLVFAELVRHFIFAKNVPLPMELLQAVFSPDLLQAQNAESAISSENHFLRDYFSLITAWLKFVTDFMVPPIERLHDSIATAAAGVLIFTGLGRLSADNKLQQHQETRFFALLLLFSLFTIFSTGAVRSYSPTAFTFRFVNVGLLFAASFFPLLLITLREQKKYYNAIVLISAVYILLLSYINVTEVGNFGYGRNHVRLTQVAHALDINDSFVVSAMPGTMWEKIDFDTVQASKHNLQDVGTGVYGSEEVKRIGQSINTLENLLPTQCKTKVIKMRRLLPDQTAYRLLGESVSIRGDVMSRVYFADDENIIRGYAIPVEPSKNILLSLFQNQQWAGFVNLQSVNTGTKQNSIVLYAYSNSEICQAENIALPDYIKPKKKTEN